jgi:hypothetical protein
MTRQEVERRKAQAVRFRDALGDGNRTDEIEDESAEKYAERKPIQVSNPKGARKMPVHTRRELLERIEELEEQNEEPRKPA